MENKGIKKGKSNLDEPNDKYTWLETIEAAEVFYALGITSIWKKINKTLTALTSNS